VDLLKEIRHNQPLEDFKDKRLDFRINENLDNAVVFDFLNAFSGVKFERVIYTRKGWNPATELDILKLIQIKNSVNEILLRHKIVDDLDKIKYCPAPWQRRKVTQQQWCHAIHN
jgi:hypothetical protein